MADSTSSIDTSSIETHHRACNLCEAICGLEIKVAGQRILSIKGDKTDPLSRGHICPKAIALQDLHNDPDRLRQPVRRVRSAGGEDRFEAISWDEALDTVAKKLVETSRTHGVDAIGIYMGNPSVHNYGMMTHQGNLFRHFRTRNRFSATSVDQLPHHLVSLWLFGHKLLLPIPDIDRTDYFLMLGANPMASNGSLWTVPGVGKRIKALHARGGKLVVVDPRRTETAAVASEHIAIRPGTDALWLSAVLNCLFEEELVRLRQLEDFTRGLPEVASALGEFTAENVAAATGIAADITRRIARELAAADAGICYGRMGVSTQRFGALCQWLIQLINIATGNLDRPGGSLFTSPALDQLPNIGRGGFARHRSRVRGLPEFDRELPAAAMAEEIIQEGSGKIRALFTGAGNPVLSTPNGRQLDAALEQLDFMVSLDPYINETTRHADVILPPTSPLEHDHYDITFHLFAMRNTARFNQPLFDKPEGALHDWEIFSALGERVAALLGVEAGASIPPDQMIDFGLQVGPYGQAQGSEHALSLARLRACPSGIDLGPLRPQLPGRLFTADKMIHCDAALPLSDLQRLRDLQRQAVASNDLLLIGRRHVRSNNSWMHNFHRLVKGKDRCTLQMHPDDLARRQLADGDRVSVSSRVGELKVKVESTSDISPGVVSLPHGWGHDRPGIHMQIAAGHAGVSCNDLTDELYIDELSGNAAVNALPVTVKAIR